MKVQRSIVKWFDAKKGYGFILNPDGGVDVFAHYSQIVSEQRFKTLRTGEIVDYELHDGAKGLHAQNIRGTNEVVNLDASGAPVSNAQAAIPPKPPESVVSAANVAQEPSAPAKEPKLETAQISVEGSP